jgi:hypothetical protein
VLFKSKKHPKGVFNLIRRRRTLICYIKIYFCSFLVLARAISVKRYFAPDMMQPRGADIGAHLRKQTFQERGVIVCGLVAVTGR